MSKSKVQQYIEDAVNAAASEIKTKGVEINNCNFDNHEHINIDNGDMTEVLLELAKAQTAIANAIVSVSKSKPTVENKSIGLNLTGISDKPIDFN